MSACYCEDYEEPSFYVDVMRKAIKQHRCHECKGAIHKCEVYQSVTGKWDGDILTYKTCQRCLDLLNYVKAHIPCVCWSFQNMRGDLLNAAMEYADEAPGLLFGAYRREILIRRHRSEAEHGAN